MSSSTPVSPEPVPERSRYHVDEGVEVWSGKVVTSSFGMNELLNSSHLRIVLIISSMLEMSRKVSWLNDDGCE